MNKENKMFADMEIEKPNFCYSKYHIDKLMISKMVSFSKKPFKYVIGYKDDGKVRP